MPSNLRSHNQLGRLTGRVLGLACAPTTYTNNVGCSSQWQPLGTVLSHSRYTVYSTPNASRVACALRKSFPSSLFFDKTAFHFPTHAQLWTSNHYSTRVSNTHGSFEVQTCAYSISPSFFKIRLFAVCPQSAHGWQSPPFSAIQY